MSERSFALSLVFSAWFSFVVALVVTLSSSVLVAAGAFTILVIVYFSMTTASFPAFFAATRSFPPTVLFCSNSFVVSAIWNNHQPNILAQSLMQIAHTNIKDEGTKINFSWV